MELALELAAKAGDAGEVPVGAVVVCGGQLAGSGYNQRESGRDATLHAEMTAIRAACRQLGGWRLPAATLYVTLEPCPMCAGAALNARIDRLVFGAPDPKGGACGSVLNVLAGNVLNHRVEVSGGLRAEESAALLRSFFSHRRQR